MGSRLLGLSDEIIRAGVLSVLLSILASKRVVLDRQHGRNRLAVGLGSLTDSAK
jgi:hypothetical protein